MPHEPKKRHSRQRQGKRRASIKLETVKTVLCKNCGAQYFSHTICAACGFYKGKLVKAPKTQRKTEVA